MNASPRRRSSFAWVLAAVLLGLGDPVRGAEAPAAPAAPATPATNYFLVSGEVTQVKPAGRSVVIKHDAIPDYMQAMTMPFEVKDTNELKDLTPGDLVSFRLTVTAEDGWIDMIQRLGRTNAARAAPRPELRRVREVEPLQVGDRLPDYPFTNELNQPIRLSQFQGQALALTFIFTRCPYPTACPRMSANFARAAADLKSSPGAPTNWHFLSLTFDPEFDTPAVLRAYAQRQGSDPQRWSFLTGAMIEIDAITEQFGVMFPREGVNFSHNFRTVVIDARGRVHRVFVGNEWKATELVAEMLKAAVAR